MGDVVIKLPLKSLREVRLFGQFLNSFVESRLAEAERMAAEIAAPFLMVRADPAAGDETRIVIFQEPSAASDFSAGWREVCGVLAA